MTEALHTHINIPMRKTILRRMMAVMAIISAGTPAAADDMTLTRAAADTATAAVDEPATAVGDEVFTSDEKLEEGIVTRYLNTAIARGMASPHTTSHPTAADTRTERMEYGRTVTGYVSAPKFGGYTIGKYAYTSADGNHSGDGFTQRLMRFYVDGTILRDFAYRIQVQTNNDKFHMKDYFIEWRRYKALRIKMGQFKRAFGMENPMNPWDIGNGDYSQLTKKLCGMGDYIGGEASSNGGRDQGLQIQGDIIPIGKDRHPLLHYQLMIANGQGINCGDADSNKDIMGTLQLQPAGGMAVGVFMWKGRYTQGDGVTVGRNRYMLSARYERDGWTLRSEYAHSTGHKLSDYNADGTWSGSGRADAWYALLGVPVTPWLKTYVRYDTYRDDATWQTAKTIYSLTPNIQLHRNLMLQPQLNYVHDRNLTKPDYCELWMQVYVRL